MIFTTVIVSCLFALLGVFQSSMVDTFLSSLAHLNTPTLSSVTTFWQVAGSVTRLALDAVPFLEVDSSPVHLSTSSIGDGFTNINNTLQDIPTTSTLTPVVGVPSRAPPGFWYSFVNLSIRAGLLFLSYVLFKLSITQFRTLFSESDTDCSPATDQRHNSANPPEHEQLTNIALALPHDTESYYNPLSFFPFSSPQRLAFFSPPPPAFIPPAISLVSYFGDAELTCVFGVPRPFYTSETAEETTDNEYDSYLMDALNIHDSGAPPAAGWCSDDEPPAARPDQDTLDAWVLPHIEPGEDPPGEAVAGDDDEG